MTKAALNILISFLLLLGPLASCCWAMPLSSGGESSSLGDDVSSVRVYADNPEGCCDELGDCIQALSSGQKAIPGFAQDSALVSLIGTRFTFPLYLTQAPVRILPDHLGALPLYLYFHNLRL